MHDSDRENATLVEWSVPTLGFPAPQDKNLPLATPLPRFADTYASLAGKTPWDADCVSFPIRSESNLSDKSRFSWHALGMPLSGYQFSLRPADDEGSEDDWLKKSTLNIGYKFKCSDDDMVSTGGVDRDNMPLDGVHGEDYGNPDIHRSGTGEIESKPTESTKDSDSAVNLDQILERFEQHPTIRMRPAGTRMTYMRIFRRFAMAIRIEQYTRRQLAGAKGKRLLLEHIATAIPLRSRKTVLSGLAKVWKFGLGLPWPIDTESDIGPLPKTRRGPTPDDFKVKAWYDRFISEPSPYLKCLWLIIAQSGQRPSTVAKLRWDHVRYDDSGQPYEIRVNGADEGLKSFADVAWRLPPDVLKALIELRQWLGAKDTDLILPWMNGWGKILQSRESRPGLLREHWLRMGDGLPKLTMKALRHWVASVCRDNGLSEQARAYMMGHEQPIHDMGDVYDNRPEEMNMARQAEKLPFGPLGIFAQPSIELTTELPADLVATLVGYRDSKVGISDVLNRLDQWRLKTSTEVSRIDA